MRQLSRLPIAAAALAATLTVSPSAQRATTPGLAFTDVTAAAGVTFRHNSGAFGQKLLPETMGSGVVVLDVDNDGRQDLFFVNGKAWAGRPPSRSLPALYRNVGGGRFADVTRAAGLAVEMYGMGGAAADYDNDGFVDLFVTGVGGNRLFRNSGKGTFTDVTARSGVGRAAFSASAAWLDYDRDGRLDLYVTNYVQWQQDKDLRCALDGKHKSYCTPEVYKGDSPWLFRNTGKGTFVDEAVAAGVAFNEAGAARAGMGTDVADFEGSGRPGVLIGNFSNETLSLYRNEGEGLFTDQAPSTSLGRDSLLTLTFGCFFFDADNDGALDIFAANGHVADDIAKVQPKIAYAQPAHLFRNLGKARFEDVAARIPALAQPVVARGAAHADIDNDGDQDIVVTVNNGPARVLRNESRGGRAIRLSLTGVKANRSAIGAQVRVTAGGVTRLAMVKTGSSYLSQSELPLTFGLGQASGVQQVEIRWPGGQVDKLGPQAAGQTLQVTEGKGVTGRVPFRR